MRTTEELLKDAEEVINTEGVYHYCEVLADKKSKEVELYKMKFKVHPVDVRTLIAELSAKLKESEKELKEFGEVLAAHKKLSPGCFDDPNI